MGIDSLYVTDAPSEDAQEAAGQVLDEVRRALREAAGECVEMPPVVLPTAIAELVAAALEEFAGGHQVALQRMDGEELTTAEAARLLGMSRPTLIDLLDHHRVPYRMVGSHRRIRLETVRELARRLQRGDARTPRVPTAAERREALREAADLSQNTDF